jgi:hypothetical protein
MTGTLDRTGAHVISRSADRKIGKPADDGGVAAPYGRGRHRIGKEHSMNLHIRDRWFALCGIASVVVELGGALVQMGKKDTHSLTWASSTRSIETVFTHPATTTVWIGAYLELLSMGFFLVFALWAARKLGGGLVGSIAAGFAIANVAVSTVSLALLDTEAYLAGHALPVETARTLVTLNGATYVATWFLTAFFMLALAPLALASGRRVLGWSAAGIAGLILIATAADPGNLGQLVFTLSLVWIVGASLALLRHEPRPTTVPAVA